MELIMKKVDFKTVDIKELIKIINKVNKL